MSPPLAHNIAVKRALVAPTNNAPQESSSVVSNQHNLGTELVDLTNNDCGPNEFEQPDYPQFAAVSIPDDGDFENDLNDDDLLELTSNMVDVGDRFHRFSSSQLYSDAVQMHSGSSVTAPIMFVEGNSSTQPREKKFVSPLTITTRVLATTGDIDNANARKPIARPPFPTPVRDRSPIIGLSSNILLRTCFRIGEVINQAHQAEKNGNHVTFELYARILESVRDGAKQLFTFCDLFHGKPPYLKAVYDITLWKSVQLFNYDSKRVLKQGRIGRCMGTMKRENKEWTMTVLNIWEATWEDIKWVEGIVNS